MFWSNWGLGRELQGEEVLSQCLPESGNLSSPVWRREQGELVGYTNIMGSKAFPVAWQGSHSVQSQVSKGTHSLHPAVSAPNYWSPGMRKLNSIWVPREPVGEQAFGEFPFLPQVGISPRKSWITSPENLYFLPVLRLLTGSKNWSKQGQEGSHSNSQTEGKLLPKARQKLRNLLFHF